MTNQGFRSNRVNQSTTNLHHGAGDRHGGAGPRAAIERSEAGVGVLAVGKRAKEDGHTALAAGGINAALANVDPEDSWQQHAACTLKEGPHGANRSGGNSLIEPLVFGRITARAAPTSPSHPDSHHTKEVASPCSGTASRRPAPEPAGTRHWQVCTPLIRYTAGSASPSDTP